MLDKVIKEFNINNFTYKLGYDVWFNIVYPSIEIYKNEILFSAGYWCDRTTRNSFNLYVYNSSSDVSNYVSTIKEMFIRLREYNEIPEIIETEYEKIYLLYKLNNFNELNINT